jgi:uncharacterized protein YceK
MKILLLILTVAMAGCSTVAVKHTNSRSTIVTARDASSAMSLAEQECAKHKRHARLIGRNDALAAYEFVFDCIE